MKRTAALRTSLVLILAAAGCVPVPVNPGYVSTASRQKGKVDLGLYAGSYFATPHDATAGGGFHVEPYLLPRLSLPIGLVAGGGAGAGGASLRTGVRFRVLPMLAVGGGLGGGGYSVSGRPRGSMYVDAELSVGGRWNVFGLSLALRPTVEVVQARFLQPMELAIALYPQPGWAITIHAYGGPIVTLGRDVDVHGWIGAGIGFYFHI